MSAEQLKTVQQALDMKVLMNHIYEYKKGVRQMVLFTCNARYEDFAVNRLKSQNIEYICTDSHAQESSDPSAPFFPLEFFLQVFIKEYRHA